jgi:hypothetical protein
MGNAGCVSSIAYLEKSNDMGVPDQDRLCCCRKAEYLNSWHRLAMQVVGCGANLIYNLRIISIYDQFMFGNRMVFSPKCLYNGRSWPLPTYGVEHDMVRLALICCHGLSSYIYRRYWLQEFRFHFLINEPLSQESSLLQRLQIR